MRKIEQQVFSHVRALEPKLPHRGFSKPPLVERQHGRSYSIGQVRASFGFGVTSFRQLVSLVAELGYNNRSMNLLFRGQTEDHRNRDGRSNIYPSIHRPKSGQTRLVQKTLDERLEALHEAVVALREQRHDFGGSGPGLYLHDEFQVALLQHHNLRKTPLVDASHSLRVAASFALPDDDSTEGWLFVLGMPHPQGSISHFIDEDIVLVKLQNVCPPEALRPHYQEGYLLGRLSPAVTKDRGDNAAYRLVGKYLLQNADGAFWDEDFKPIPKTALLPPDDQFLDELLNIVGPDPVA